MIAKPAVCKARVHLFWAASLLPQTRALKQDCHQTRCNIVSVESLSNPTLALCLIHKTEKYIRAMWYPTPGLWSLTLALLGRLVPPPRPSRGSLLRLVDLVNWS